MVISELQAEVFGAEIGSKPAHGRKFSALCLRLNNPQDPTEPKQYLLVPIRPCGFEKLMDVSLDRTREITKSPKTRKKFTSYSNLITAPLKAPLSDQKLQVIEAAICNYVSAANVEADTEDKINKLIFAPPDGEEYDKIVETPVREKASSSIFRLDESRLNGGHVLG